MEFPLDQVRAVIGARQINPRNGNVVVRGWSIDSRTIAQGDLFFAIKGEQHDGHKFVHEVLEKGAAAAVVSEGVPSVGGPLLVVSDAIEALQRIARWARTQWSAPVVAITGSAGKTTTKDITAELLGLRFRVAKTAGNFNNHIGLPLTILRTQANAEIGVFELGMNHAGEIRHLADICKPQVGVVTNVGYAHIEAFSGIEGVAAAKRELIEALPPTGTAILNADDERVARFGERHCGRTITYGFSTTADIRATDLEMGSGAMSFVVHGVRFESQLKGRHSVLNILAGIAVANAFGISLGDLVEPIANFQPGKMRGERKVWNNIVILDDSYNANPEAMLAMIDVLRKEPAQRRISVLGEMLELGRMAESLHRQLGSHLAQAGVDVVVGVHGASQFLVEEARKAGVPKDSAFFFEDPEGAGTFLRGFVRPGDAVLFKGSRGTHVERALAAMKE
jgi:UDP-N-acetylmuramoyl-tripeptide--D-alanyl-D-alanine ligase